MFKGSGLDTIGKKLLSIASSQEKSGDLKRDNLHNVNGELWKSIKAAAEKKKSEYMENLPT